MSELKSAALALAARGMSVFPCKARDKIPLTKHGCKDASSLEGVGAWWDQWPDANIGLACGSKSGVWVLDIDGEQGEASLRELEARMQPLPATVEAITGGGGRHLFFRLPDFDGAPEIRNSAGQLGAGLDVRGEGGYVVAPPSIHPSGKRYAWSVDSASEFADPPVWLVALLTLPAYTGQNQFDRRPKEHWQKIVGGVGEGQRNVSAASLTGRLLVSGFDPDTTLQLVLGWNMRNNPPMPEDEVVRGVESIVARELKKRRAPQ